MAHRKKYKKHKKKKITAKGYTFRIILIISAAALFISYLSIFINPTKIWVPLFFGLYYIPIVTLNIILLIISLFRKKKYLLIPLIALLPSLLFADLFVKTGKEESVHGKEKIEVMTYNVGRFSAGEKNMSLEETASRIKSFFEQERPDVLCIQEFMIKDTSMLNNTLPKYPYRYYHFFKGNNFFGNITLSKYPIIHKDKISFNRSTNLCIYTDIQYNDKIIRIYNCHLESYSISFTSLIKRLSKKGEFSNEIIGVHGKLKGTNIRRSEQVNTVLGNIKGSDYPTIICGDFNDTPMSYTYHKLSKGRKDSFIEGGKGFSSTYSTLWPLLRIDYILLPEAYDADQNITFRIPLSDHYPVSTIIYCN
ncbi:MAG: endonuclease/exonuclease/phosphatase family protein [Bacteroidales bacterium]|nr:endonuclease/exonuclease/phosphatase family protein [Bacteroidales bacterium]